MAEIPRIGKYQVLRPLGKGGMGEVWLGEHPELGIPVAIKTLSRYLAERDPVHVRRFLQEARTAILITHTNLVRVFDVGTDDDLHYIVMEYVDGRTVRDILHADGRMAPKDALVIIAAVALALQAAPEHNVIHRDINPDNIMLNQAGVVKLCDMGLAKQLEGISEQEMTTAGVAFGTPAYIAPEQAENAKHVDARADIYSLGATFYHMITGQAPFTGNSAAVVMMDHMRKPLPHPSTHDSELPDNICSVACKMMAKKPGERYQSAAELLVDVEAILAHDTAAGQLLCKSYSRTKADAQLESPAKAKWH